jgi:hypothetical protein
VKALSISTSWFAFAVVGVIIGDGGVALPDTCFGVPCKLSIPSSVNISLKRRTVTRIRITGKIEN